MSVGVSGWRPAALWGTLWGLAVMLAEAPTLPLGGLGVFDLTIFGVQSFLPWLCAGMVWAWGVKIAEDRGRWVVLLLPPIATAANILAKMGFETIEPHLTTAAGEFLRDVPVSDIALYFAWTNLVYGSLYAVGYLVARRGMHGRALLAAQRRERSEADSALREARLASLRGQLQPDLLIEGLHALRARFAQGQAEGDRLFDVIIAFLRAAMPAVRHRASALAAELETVRCYSTLRRMLGRAGVTIGAVEPGAAGIALPPLLLLPLVEQLARAASAHGEPELTTRIVDSTYTIAIVAAAPGAPIAAALDALDTGVADAGGAVSVSRERARITIVVSLPLRAATSARSPAVLLA